MGGLSQLPDWLDWLLCVAEPLVVLGITLVVFYIGYTLVFGPEQSGHQTRFKELLRVVNDNWKAGLLLLVLLFYRTVRIFLEQAEEAFGVKRPLRGEAEEGSSDARQEKA
ncbi:MAG TPA: hypothetical protein VJN21_04255 [Candidatus Acidoferrales bacterium]|nr:hypothetical protein [Candidatus Acidoferrales bacterium]